MGNTERPERPPPEATAGRTAREYRVRSVALVGIFALLLFFALYLARTLFLPIVIAVLLSFILKPVVRAFRKIRIHEGLAAAIVLFGLLGFVVIGVNSLTEPAARWIATAPASLRQIEHKVRQLAQPLIQLNRAARQVERMTTVSGETAEPSDGTPAPAPSQTAAPAIQQKTLTDRFLGYTKSLIVGSVEMFVLLFFLLASGDLFIQKLVRILPRVQDRREAVAIAREIEHRISTYLLTITLINAAEGTLVGIAMYFAGMPNPLLWGVLAGVVNFVPYLGFWLAETVIILVAFITFDSIGEALLPPLLYLGINFIEGNFIAPIVLGQRLTLNPVVIFLSLIVWGWMWGIPGALLAVPLLMVFKIICEHVKTLAPVSEFLSR